MWNGVVGGLVDISNPQTRYMLQKTQFDENLPDSVSFCSIFLTNEGDINNMKHITFLSVFL